MPPLFFLILKAGGPLVSVVIHSVPDVREFFEVLNDFSEEINYGNAINSTLELKSKEFVRRGKKKINVNSSLLCLYFQFKAPSVASLSIASEQEQSFLGSRLTSCSRPNSHKPKASSTSSIPWKSINQKADLNANVTLRQPQQNLAFTDNEFIGLNAMDVIKKLRHRLNRSTDLDAIADDLDPDEDDNNISRLYIKEDDGKFLYCLPKSQRMRGARYNPYDLICVTSQDAQAAKEYFTITASAVTLVIIAILHAVMQLIYRTTYNNYYYY